MMYIGPECVDLTQQAAESALKGSNLADLGDAMLSLTDDGRVTLGKAERAVERIRRKCLNVLEAASKAGTEETGASALHLAMRQWLIGSVELAEDILADPPMVCFYSYTL
jgi:hypothetical protein